MTDRSFFFLSVFLCILSASGILLGAYILVKHDDSPGMIALGLVFIVWNAINFSTGARGMIEGWQWL